jgi:predicted MFS family arabinose efflux permease
MDPALVPQYGWRIAFVLGGLGGVLSFLLRRSMEESPEFARMRAVALRQPFRELLRTHRTQVLVGVGLLAATACFTGLYFSHLPAYLTAVLEYEPRQAVMAQTLGVIAHALSILAVGWLGDRMAPRHLLRAGATTLLLLAYPFYAVLAAETLSLTVVLVTAGIVMGLTNGSFAVLLTDLFPTRIRFSGVALVFNIAFTTFSGMAPLVATTLIRETGSVLAPAMLASATGLIAIVASFWVHRFGGQVLAPAGRRRL